METKILFPLLRYIQRYLIMFFKALNLFLKNKYVAEIQLPGNGIWLICDLHITEVLHRMLIWLGIGDYKHKGSWSIYQIAKHSPPHL
jgi:hypothetical protein